MTSESILRLNVGGRKCLIGKALAIKYPRSQFAAMAQNRATKPGIFYVDDVGEFFVERSPILIDLMLQRLRTGNVECPSTICQEAFEDELCFWGLDENADVVGPRRTSSAMTVTNRPFRLEVLWHLLEHPTSSKPALLLNILCVTFIVLSIINMNVASLPAFRNCVGRSMISQEESVNGEPEVKCDGASIMIDVIESICLAWFTIELLLRFLACPDRRQFVRTPLNIVDFLATFPFYIELLIWTVVGKSKQVSGLLVIMRVFRVLRVFRSLRLARYVDSLRLLGELVWNSRKHFSMLALFIAIATIGFSSLLYFVEKNADETLFTSIPHSFWWCIVTLTTVGYGDMVPQTTLGKAITSVACISGILIVAFPVSILTDSFRSTYVSHRQELIRKRKRPSS